MRLWWLAIPCVGALGCDQVFGLDRSTAVVTGSYLVRTLRNDPGGAPVFEDVPRPPIEISAEVRLADGTQHNIDVDSAGRFSFARSTEADPYTLTFRAAGTVSYQLSVPEVKIVERLAGPLDRDAAPPGTRLQLTISNSPFVDAATLGTTGVWTRSDVTGMSPINADWTAAMAIDGPAGLLGGDDAIHYLGSRNVMDALGTYKAVEYVATVPQVTLAPGATTAFNALAVPAVKSHCAHVVASPATESDRMHAAMPLSTPLNGTRWSLVAVPDIQFPVQIGFTLAGEDTNGAPANLDRNAIMYATPFPGHSTIAVMYIANTRTVPNGTSSVAIYGESLVAAAVPPDCNAPAILTGGAPLAADFVVDGTPLTVDGQPVDIDRRRDVQISWTPTAGEDAVWLVGVYQLTGTTPTARIQLITNEPSISIDPDLLAINQRYVVQVRASTGIPKAATGDFTVLTLPRSSTSMYSTMFIVQ